MDELMENMREVITLCLVDSDEEEPTEFVGVQKVAL